MCGQMLVLLSGRCSCCLSLDGEVVLSRSAVARWRFLVRVGQGTGVGVGCPCTFCLGRVFLRTGFAAELSVNRWLAAFDAVPGFPRLLCLFSLVLPLVFPPFGSQAPLPFVFFASLLRPLFCVGYFLWGFRGGRVEQPRFFESLVPLSVALSCPFGAGFAADFSCDGRVRAVDATATVPRLLHAGLLTKPLGLLVLPQFLRALTSSLFGRSVGVLFPLPELGFSFFRPSGFVGEGKGIMESDSFGAIQGPVAQW